MPNIKPPNKAWSGWARVWRNFMVLRGSGSGLIAHRSRKPLGAEIAMSKSIIEEFTCSDGSSGIVVGDQFIYRIECSRRTWSSNARNNNAWSQLKLLFRKIKARAMARCGDSRKSLKNLMIGINQRRSTM